MGLLKLISRIGGPGFEARWAGRHYHSLRCANPDRTKVSDREIFRSLIAERYARQPNPRAQARLADSVDGGVGLREFVAQTLMAEQSLNSLPSVFYDAIDEELAKFGFPRGVLYGDSEQS